jgi:energy-coupling factor transport system permease protein
MKHGFDARAWTAWLAAAAVLTLSIDNPLASIAALLALGVVALAFRAPGPEGRSAALFFKLGFVVIVSRIVLFGLTGRPGATTLLTLPSIGLPAWLGGFSIGGRVTAEVVTQQVAEGLKIAAFLACFGVFLSTVQTYRVLRLLPRFLFEAGLVVGIAITFVPSLLRSVADVRDAQRLRGHRFRGVRSLRPLVLPVLSRALERSLTLASSMESRGFGRAPSSRANAAPNEMPGHASVLAGIASLLGAGACALAGLTPAAVVLALVAVTTLAFGFRALSRSVARTRLRPEKLDVWDWALVACAALMAAATFAARELGAAHWYAFPVVRWPSADVRVLLLGAALAAPALIAPARRAFYTAAERRHPVPAHEAAS